MDEEEFSNYLSLAQMERLAILSEECGEVVQAVGKILRHGYESYNPLDKDTDTNRRDLERELGNLVFAIDMLCNEDLTATEISRHKKMKSKSIKKWLHHQAD